MRAKRRLIDTPLASLSALSLSSSSSRRLSIKHAHSQRAELRRGALPFIDRQLLADSEFFKVQFSKYCFLNSVKSTDRCTFVSEQAELQDWNAGRKKKTKKTRLLVASLCFQYYQCSLQINSQTTIAPVPPPRVLSVFTTDRVTKVQSQRAVSDLETALVLN